MYLWQRLAPPEWWKLNEARLLERAQIDLATIERPGRKSLIVEVSCRSRQVANEFRREFNGRVSKLPSDWLQQFTRAEATKPLRIGNRLVVTSAGRVSAPGSGHNGTKSSRRRCRIVIPAGAAFGTGQHATTAMSLRFLEELTRDWKPGWSMVDLGTGSGILAIAGKAFGASRVVALDIDPVAISTAKANARNNRADGIQFKIANVLKWRPVRGAHVITANLFSELLIPLLPKLQATPWLVLSGVMRDQERELLLAIRKTNFTIVKIRRRGKWIAMLLKSSAASGFGR